METTTDNKLWLLPHGIAVRDNRHLERYSGAFSIINNDNVFKNIKLEYGKNPTQHSPYGFRWVSKVEASSFECFYPKLQLAIHSKDEIMEEFRMAIEVLEAIENKMKETSVE